MNPLAAPLRQFLETQLSQDVLNERDEGDRAIGLLTTLITIGALGLGFFPLWLLAGSPGGSDMAIVVALSVAPLAIAGYILHSGRIQRGWRAAVTIVAGSITWFAVFVAGTWPAAIVLLSVLPALAFRQSRREIGFAVAAASIAMAATSIAYLVKPDSSVPEIMANTLIAAGILAIVARLAKERRKPLDPADAVALGTGPNAGAMPARQMAGVSEPHEPEFLGAIDAITLLAHQIARASTAGLGDRDRLVLANLIRIAGDQLRERHGKPSGYRKPFLEYDSRYTLRGIGGDELAKLLHSIEATDTRMAVRRRGAGGAAIVIELPLNEQAPLMLHPKQGALKSA